ncbi:MAG TPA: twin-arginine translocase TatA/TatE family subunit [Candidatus Acidoferrales bacterium]|nr:twin-arginine translocase TatA/TatE family subunit [Candidatus Acidoferrales bacterium]
MSFSETIFLFVLALVIFGPKKLPEIARQAGRLLAELRRASNEFKSQIETEIAHLEVEKKQTILPPAEPPQGAVASLSLNPAASEAAPHQSGATLAAPAEAPVADSTSISSPANTKKPSLGSDSAALVSSTTEPAASSAAQDSHV